MKKIILTIIMLFAISINSNAQWATYTPLTQEEILAPALIMKQRYDNNAAKVDALIESIFELKKQTNDENFLKAMDMYYQRLKGFYRMDLAKMDNQIRDVRFAILEEVDKYNRKIKNQNQNNTTTKKKDASNLKGYQKVYENSPILEEPDMSANQIGKATNSMVEIIFPYNDNFYKVRNGTIEGYLWIGWFK